MRNSLKRQRHNYIKGVNCSLKLGHACDGPIRSLMPKLNPVELTGSSINPGLTRIYKHIWMVEKIQNF